MRKEIATLVQEAQRVPNRINPRQKKKKKIPRHILIKLTKSNTKNKYSKQEGKAINNTQGDPHMDNS